MQIVRMCDTVRLVHCQAMRKPPISIGTQNWKQPMLLIIAEKPGIYDALSSLPIALKNTDIVYTYAYGLFEPSNPNITFQDIPYTPELKDDRLKPYFAEEPIHWVNGGVKKKNHARDIMAALKDRMHDYSEVIVATDADKTGAYSGAQLLEKLPGIDTNIVTRIPTISWRKQDILKGYHDRQRYTDSGINVEAKQQYLKRTFDYWWKINAEFVFGEAIKQCGLQGNPAVSKYELMLYFFLAMQPAPMSADEIVKWMQNPPSLKTYPEPVRDKVSIGSLASQMSILETAVNRGAVIVSYIEADNKRGVKMVYALSGRTHKFLSLMHPKTRDNDLPYRLYEWMSCDLSEIDVTREKIRRYIHTIFGRQLRYQRRNKTQ